jgi:hypothetical protein
MNASPGFVGRRGRPAGQDELARIEYRTQTVAALGGRRRLFGLKIVADEKSVR